MTEAKVNEYELSMDGCYGSHVAHDDIEGFLEDCFKLNAQAEKEGTNRFATCIWGHAGVGKTEMAKEFKNKKVTWRGKEYGGYKIFDVPIAQFEEMGDLHGMPYDSFLMIKNEEKEWVHSEDLITYRNLGWERDLKVSSRTVYAAPDWVPTEEGPSILILDDWNRASIRIVKGCMQLFQNYGMVSWKLPDGCNIVMTGNPEQQDYLVTSLDSAILTRIKHITLKHDAKTWALWATKNNIDERGINFILQYPEMMLGKERTNPRTLTEFFKHLRFIDSITDNKNKVTHIAHSLLDEETVTAFLVFASRDMMMVVEPEDILDNKNKAFEQIKKIMGGKESRPDVLGVICERMFAFMVSGKCEQTESRIENFQKFVTMKEIPEDLRHSVCRRIAKIRDGQSARWLTGCSALKELIMDTMRG